MTWFTRLLKGNPNHDPHTGEFTSAGGGSAGGNGAISPTALRTASNSKHHTNAAAHAVMNAIKAKVWSRTFDANEPMILAAVKDVLTNRPQLTSWGKADAIKAKLMTGATSALRSDMEQTRFDGRQKVYAAIHEALVSTEKERGPAAATVTSPYTGPGTPRATAPTPAALTAQVTGSSTPPRGDGESLSAYASRVGDARRAGGSPPVSGPSSPSSAARAMSSPQAAAAQAPPPPAPPKYSVADMKAAGFAPGRYDRNDDNLKEAAKNWDTVFKGQTPQQVMDTMFKAKLGTNFAVTANYQGYGTNKEMTLGVDNDAVQISRKFSVKPNGDVEVDHSFFKVKQAEERGHDFGKQFLSNSMNLYQKIGVTNVDVHANIDVGGYAWAKYGFVPNASSWSAMQMTMTNKVKATPTDAEFTAGKKESLIRMLKNPDPRTLHDFADSTITTANAATDSRGNKVPLAKSLMLGSDWYGKLDLRSPVTMERFNAYVGKAR